ncbi:hypothetical protein GCM10020001_014100 [Nonomuraea salmonea]
MLNTAFFPEMDPVAGSLAAFSTFAVAFISRPLGSAVFGHWGDRIGRKSMLVVSLLVMGLSTVAIGLLPGYAAIGVIAPVLLVLLRFTQGIGLGGEWGGAALLATEHAPPGKRGLYAMFPQLGPSAGFIVANGLFLVLGETLSDGQFESWGWRLPFVGSLLLVIVGLYVRLKISETPVFQAAMDQRRIARVPFAGLMRHQWRRVLLGAGAMTIAYTLFYTATTYCLAYGTDVLEISKTTMLALSMIGVVFMAAGTVVSAMVSDRLGRRRTLITGVIGAIVWGAGDVPADGDPGDLPRRSRAGGRARADGPGLRADGGPTCPSCSTPSTATAARPSPTASAACSAARCRPWSPPACRRAGSARWPSAGTSPRWPSSACSACSPCRRPATAPCDGRASINVDGRQREGPSGWSGSTRPRRRSGSGSNPPRCTRT